MYILEFIVGLVLLVIAGEMLVKGAVAIANNLKVPRLLIGLTIVSFGTSSPELVVSVHSALSDHADIALGNVLGSNVCNLSIVLGLTAMVFPIAVNRKILRIDWIVMMGATILLYVFMLDKMLVLLEGIVLFLGLIFYVFVLIKYAGKEAVDLSETYVRSSVPHSFIRLVLGCVGLYFGSEFFVEGAIDMAYIIGVDERVIGLSMVAFGTSIPELVTSIIAAYKKEADIALGNLIGSNTFNILSILGITAMIEPIPVNETLLRSDVLWVSAIALLILPLLFYKKIGRFGGLMLFCFYVVYIVSLFGLEFAT